MTRYWFRPKRYGYGATPITWEGWAVTFAAVCVIAVTVIVANILVDKPNAVAWLVLAALIAAWVWWFTQFCRRRTDGEWRWRWGERSGGAAS